MFFGEYARQLRPTSVDEHIDDEVGTLLKIQ